MSPSLQILCLVHLVNSHRSSLFTTHRYPGVLPRARRADEGDEPILCPCVLTLPSRPLRLVAPSLTCRLSPLSYLYYTAIWHHPSRLCYSWKSPSTEPSRRAQGSHVDRCIGPRCVGGGWRLGTRTTTREDGKDGLGQDYVHGHSASPLYHGYDSAVWSRVDHECVEWTVRSCMQLVMS